jgi:polyisoprenoid-binding protein YceI
MTTLDPTPATGLSQYAGSWVLDPAHTTITFHTKAMWVMAVKGTVRAQEGHGQVGEDGTVQGHLVIDATSIGTGNKKRDAHLQTADFFDTAKYPTIDFELTSARFVSPGRVALEGNLSMLGQQHPVVLEAAVEADDTSATISGEIADLDRSKWGLTWSKMGAGLHNKVVVHAALTRAPVTA